MSNTRPVYNQQESGKRLRLGVTNESTRMCDQKRSAISFPQENYWIVVLWLAKSQNQASDDRKFLKKVINNIHRQ